MLFEKVPLRRVFFFLFAASIFPFFIWVAFPSSPLPTPAHPLRFYSNQMRQDLKILFRDAIRSSHQSIFLSVYGVADPDILSLIGKKSLSGCEVIIEYDPSASANLPRLLPKETSLRPSLSSGLMHKKIIITDAAHILIGSANLTETSLTQHDNFVIGLYSPLLGDFLRNPKEEKSLLFPIGVQQGEFFLLPDRNHLGMNRLKDVIASAKKEIFVALFTLTHPALIQSLIDAQARGVNVVVAIDYYSGRGSSKKAVELLKNQGVTVLLSRGQQLLHHKWALIDQNQLVMGSANWTKAAFSKNADFLFFLSPLLPPQHAYLKKLRKSIVLESLSVI